MVQSTHIFARHLNGPKLLHFKNWMKSFKTRHFQTKLIIKIWVLKGGYPIIFASNVFPNSHLIQKCIQNQQQLLIVYTFLNQMRVGKIFNTKMIGWTHFIIMQKIALSLQRPSARFKNWVTKPSNNSIFIRPRKPLEFLNIL